MVVQAPSAAPAMPFGKHRGVPIDRVPTGYLRWWIDAAVRTGGGFRAAIVAELVRREDRVAALATSAGPINLPGQNTDEFRHATNEAIYRAAVAAGEFVIDPATPVRSQALAWYLEWCRDWGQAPRVREITWAEIEQAVRDGRELPT